MSVHRATVL